MRASAIEGTIARAIAIAAAIWALAGCETAPTQPPIEIVQVHEAPGRSKADLCRAARDWATLNFKETRAAVEVYDPEAGSMIAKGVFMIPGFIEQLPARFTLSVECKDGRARASYRDVTVTLTNQGTMTEATPKDSSMVKARTYSEQRLLELDASLDAALKKDAGNW